MCNKSPVNLLLEINACREVASFGEVRELRRVEDDPGTSLLRTVGSEDIGVPLAWRILHEQSLYPYHLQRLLALAPPAHRARMVFCQWLLAKCVINTLFVDNILFTGEAEFTGDGTVNFHSTHDWAHGNHHTTVASRH
jgi:hypothetical protein